MSSLPTAPDGQIAELVDDGYDMVLESGHLVVRRLPYVGPSGLRRDGRLILPVAVIDGVVTDASGDHRIWFAGDEPRDEQGQALGSAGQNHGFANGEAADYMLSFKPTSGAYAGLHDKIQHYAKILLGAARELDVAVTKAPGGFHIVPDNLPLVYADTNTTRAGLVKYSSLFRGHTIAIVGVGGTGSYILDQVAKTWVDRIVLIDGDQFENHNAFRAPGAAAHSVVQTKPNKAEYFAHEYSRMHTGITAHPVALTTDNLGLLEEATFVFLAAADASARPEIMQWLRDRRKPFIDVGMSFREGEGGLTGMTKVSAYLPGDDAPLPNGPALPPDEDDYRSNIQVAELNALNAIQAIIQWKRHLGFYATHTAANQSVYKLFLNELRNGDIE